MHCIPEIGYKICHKKHPICRYIRVRIIRNIRGAFNKYVNRLDKKDLSYQKETSYPRSRGLNGIFLKVRATLLDWLTQTNFFRKNIFSEKFVEIFDEKSSFLLRIAEVGREEQSIFFTNFLWSLNNFTALNISRKQRIDHACNLARKIIFLIFTHHFESKITD